MLLFTSLNLYLNGFKIPNPSVSNGLFLQNKPYEYKNSLNSINLILWYLNHRHLNFNVLIIIDACLFWSIQLTLIMYRIINNKTKKTWLPRSYYTKLQKQ